MEVSQPHKSTLNEICLNGKVPDPEQAFQQEDILDASNLEIATIARSVQEVYLGKPRLATGFWRARVSR
jgi:hypothetical protein